MPISKVRNFGKYGVISDIPPYDLPPEAWSDALNVRFVANRFEKMPGYVPTLGINPDKAPILTFLQEPNAKASQILCATGETIYLVRGDGYIPINESGVKYKANFENPWSSTVLSNVVIFNNNGDVPVSWTPNDPTLAVKKLPGWGINKTSQTSPSDWRCNSIQAYKNYLLALNTLEDGEIYPQRVRWSGVAQTHLLPDDWIEDDPAKDGGFVDLSDCSGSIIDGRALRDYFIIYTDEETYIMKYVGGQFVFDVQKLFPDSGIISSNCVANFDGGNHFVVSREDIYVHDGSTRQSIASKLVREKVLRELTSVNYKSAKVFAYPERKEVWVCYATQTAQVGDTSTYDLDKAAIWNWENGTWTFAELPNILWMSSVVSPDSDIRNWDNPLSLKTVTPTEIKLDVPFYSLPVGFDFRVDVLYKPGQGLQTSESLKWTSSDPTVGTLKVDPIDHSATFSPKKIGVTVIKFEFVDASGNVSNASGMWGEMSVTVTAANSAAVLRPHQSADPSTPITNPRPEPWSDPTNQWDADEHTDELWDKKGFSFTSNSFLASSMDTALYQMDTGVSQVRYTASGQPKNVKPVSAFIQRSAISMADEEPDLAYHKTWRTVYPLASGFGTLYFTLGGSDDPFTMPVNSETRLYQIGQDYKVDCFTNHRYLSIEIRDDFEGDWQMSGFDLDYFLGGRF